MIDSEKIVEQPAKEMPQMRTVMLRMTNLRLHASGVFSNVYRDFDNAWKKPIPSISTTPISQFLSWFRYRGTLLEPAPQREIAIKKTWPENRERNFEMLFLTGIGRKPHKNVVQMIFAFSNRSGKHDRASGFNSLFFYLVFFVYTAWLVSLLQYPMEKCMFLLCESFVFEFLPDTLASVIKREKLDTTDIKLYAWQLFNGLRYLSSHSIVHRDIKPMNVLLDHLVGLLKIGDFGSAKTVRKVAKSTAYQVSNFAKHYTFHKCRVTRFYRPPELLLGAEYYNWTVVLRVDGLKCSSFLDVWSAGCVLGEMIRGKVLFPGRHRKHQLKLIFLSIGSPTAEDVKVMRVPTEIIFDGYVVVGTGLGMLCPNADPHLIGILSKILVYPPKERLHGRGLLLHPAFDSILQLINDL
uniref:Protein kinase domain-containing protein n=1 Tax=Angiostrongylus cantonensis TaxID=6313 RepID=A0A158P725_ANGCA